MNYNLLTSSDLNAAQITSEVTEQVVTKTNRWISFWNEHVPDLISFGVEIGFSLLIFFVGRFLIRWIRRIVRRSIERSSADTGVEQFIDSLLKFLLYTLLLFIIIQNLGVPSTSIAAVIASAGVAVSLALQESLSNLAGGIQILLLKPFVVGDYIREDNKGNEGTVEEIHIFYTRLSTIDKKVIILPNGLLANNSLTNVTSNDIRLLELKVGISYSADLKKAKAILEQLLCKEPRILTQEEHVVFVDDLADSAVTGSSGSGKNRKLLAHPLEASGGYQAHLRCERDRDPLSSAGCTHEGRQRSLPPLTHLHESLAKNHKIQYNVMSRKSYKKGW